MHRSTRRADHLRRNTQQRNFIDVPLTPTTLDSWLVRTRIVAALRPELPAMDGVVVDLGCGVQPYRSLLLTAPSRATAVIGLDLPSETYTGHDVAWDGLSAPIASNCAQQVLLTEVLEHCPAPGVVLGEAFRVLRPGGRLFVTVPFLWPLHDVPHDEYRYTPYSLNRFVAAAGFAEITTEALGGWDASLAQMLGLWLRRSPMGGRRRKVLSTIALPLIRHLANRDQPPTTFVESSMITGLTLTATKPAASP